VTEIRIYERLQPVTFVGPRPPELSLRAPDFSQGDQEIRRARRARRTRRPRGWGFALPPLNCRRRSSFASLCRRWTQAWWSGRITMTHPVDEDPQRYRPQTSANRFRSRLLRKIRIR